MYCSYYELIPLGKGWGPLHKQTWIPFTQGCFVPSLVAIGPVVLEKKIRKNVKSLQTDGRQVIRGSSLSACTWNKLVTDAMIL